MLIKRIYRRVKRMAGLGPRPSDTMHGGFFTAQDVRTLAAKPVMSDEDTLALSNPSAKVQESFVGASFDAAFTEAAKFLNQLIDLQYPGGVPKDLDGVRILDFGCGWGRLLRLLRNKPEMAAVRLYGCDPLPQAVSVCRRSLPGVTVIPVGTKPPSDFRDGIFDVAYACSVFSHLSEAANLAWATELHRILKPGGGVFVSTQARSFLQVCREHRDGTRPNASTWHENLARSFVDPDSEKRYDSGELLYAPGVGGSILTDESYGEAVVPRKFFADRWGELGFDLVDWWEHPQVGGQNNAFLRKR